MFDLGRFAPDDNLNFCKLGAGVVQVLRRARNSHLFNLQAR